MEFDLVFSEPDGFNLIFGVSGFQVAWAVNCNVVIGA